jgi:protein gp37
MWKMSIYNPWHGCHKISPGCANCYVYRRDEMIGKDASQVTKTSAFDLPLKKKRNGKWKLDASDGDVYTCMTSDFFLEEADAWRDEVWKMIETRQDLFFVIITKRIDRAINCLPSNWNEGYENVRIMCTCENQQMADKRLPVFEKFPCRHKAIIHEPMLGSVVIAKWLERIPVEQVICGGESSENARICKYEWVLHTRKQCEAAQVNFYFKQTGARFEKDGRLYHIERKYQMDQAQKAGIDLKYK